MPCYDTQGQGSTKIVYINGIAPEQRDRAIEYSLKMEAMVCALMNELDRRGIGESVVAEASRNGLIDIMGLWDQHKKTDISKIANDIHHRYSKDEQEIIRKLLTPNK